MSPRHNLSAVLLRAQTDARLEQLARAGHERAFEAIVERYRRPLEARSRRMLSPQRAEDVVQQTFLSTWSALMSGTEIEDLRAWLFHVARNHALNAVRASGYDYDELHESLVGAGSCEADAERRRHIRETLRGIAALPERQREALLLTAVQGRSHAEVAAQFGLTDTGLRQLVRRARSSLRAAATAVTPWPVLNWAVSLQGSAGLVRGGATVAVIAAVVVPAPAVVEVPRTRAEPAKQVVARTERPRAPAAKAAAATPVAAARPVAATRTGARKQTHEPEAAAPVAYADGAPFARGRGAERRGRPGRDRAGWRPGRPRAGERGPHEQREDAGGPPQDGGGMRDAASFGGERPSRFARPDVSPEEEGTRTDIEVREGAAPPVIQEETR